ncbi:MAG: UDP-N-acetylglucosamine 2-epimerase (non-hydrolyzing) [Acidobacteriota bacterium]|nr:MAG: UDP-N-acetylglucosamine 2-epimerase (non-hydrolyzing) [Acidobacteriota bacterium]
MKIMTIFGTRPEIIRLSLIMRVLDQHCDHITVHTGQNFDHNLSAVFFDELEIRRPDISLAIRSNRFAEQAAAILERVDTVLDDERPDRVLILGDTNSALSAIAAARRGIPVFHMEAGNRCYDDRVPEEVNRRIIDHSSTILLPYTERSKENLVREGIPRDRIFITGNPIFEVLEGYKDKIEANEVLNELGVRPYEYFLATIHRSENVDDGQRLANIFRGLHDVTQELGKPVLVSVHPRTAEKLNSFNIDIDPDQVRLLEAMGFIDFVWLERNSLAVLTDSGTVQEECAIFGIPNVTVRDVTERPETVECGSNILSGAEPSAILAAVKLAVAQPALWSPPSEYKTQTVSSTVCKILLGRLSLREHH